VLVTARDRTWLDHAVAACTGNASSTILCDCEAGLDRYVEPFGTPDGRPGAVVQFHVPRFWKDRVEKLGRSLLVRVSQNVLTCPTTACFNVLPAVEQWFPLGRKLAYFGDGHQFKAERSGRRVYVVPILSGEFVVERRVGWADGLMGGNQFPDHMADDIRFRIKPAPQDRLAQMVDLNEERSALILRKWAAQELAA
jgi:formylmethanofuran--tetrahydromethanopterin N-formyltransferase